MDDLVAPAPANSRTRPLEVRYRLDKTSPVPLYLQLKSKILAEIESGALKAGDLLPSEAELVAALAISRPTVRQALSELSVEGYVHKQRGRGSFVSYPKIEGRFLSKLQSFAEEMRQQRLTPSTTVLSLAKIDGIPQVNDRLGLPHSEPLIALSRLRFADGAPVVIVDTCLPYTPFAGLLTADLENASLYDTLERDYATRVSRVARTIEAAPAAAQDAELLRVKQGAPVCLVHTVAYSVDNRAVEHSVARYRGDMTRFSLELYR